MDTKQKIKAKRQKYYYGIPGALRGGAYDGTLLRMWKDSVHASLSDNDGQLKVMITLEPTSNYEGEWRRIGRGKERRRRRSKRETSRQIVKEVLHMPFQLNCVRRSHVHYSSSN